ncbi:hypothetical protein GC722_00575 [Auraticoccus sp. F435]|uniref:Uncharacterized protein n=1 Tax=Auraticoccus cholistanensis TaxID=2656650 RepID=A0A6A9UTM0_9ACTN|nr:hypothetical protein [Auraticoccus cholistanensis]MVA74537.1 hypothetical protein [Auraticoccus cholistanensis]
MNDYGPAASLAATGAIVGLNHLVLGFVLIAVGATVLGLGRLARRARD